MSDLQTRPLLDEVIKPLPYSSPEHLKIKEKEIKK